MGHEVRFFMFWLVFGIGMVAWGLALWRDPYMPDRHGAAWLVYRYPPEHFHRGARRISAGATIGMGLFFAVFSVAVLIAHLPVFD